MSKSTATDLVTELEKIPSSPILDIIISEAKGGEFHDLRSRKYVFPKLRLVDKLEDLMDVDENIGPVHYIAISHIILELKTGVYDEGIND